MAYENILVEKSDGVGLITLNRPAALNALCITLTEEMAVALDDMEADDSIGCILLTGSEKAFAAGADIKEMKDKTYMEAYGEDFITATWERITTCRKPVVAAVAGYALGGGCEMAMMCDFIIAAENAKFGQPEITLGVLPGAGGTQRLTRYVGKSKAMDLCLTGRMMDAAEAERAGLVSRVVPLESLQEEAMSRGQEDRRHVAASDHDDEGIGEPGLRDHFGRGHSLRAAAVPLLLCHRGPEGRHARLRGEAEACLEASLNHSLSERTDSV